MASDTEPKRATGFTMFDNYFLDHVMPRVTSAEWKIISAVLRMTVGWTDGKGGRKKEALMSIDQFAELTGLSREAANTAVIKACERTVVRRRTQQCGRQRSFSYAAVPRANLKGLTAVPHTGQEKLPFDSESEIPNRKFRLPTADSESEIPTANAPVLLSVKESRSKERHTQELATQTSVCIDQQIDRQRYKAYARAQPEIKNPNGWLIKAERTREYDSLVIDWEREQEAMIAEWERERAGNQ
jgi:hypothetical protein